MRSEVSGSAGKCEENVVEINHFLLNITPFLEMVVSHLQVDVQIGFPFLASHKDCTCKILRKIFARV